MTRRNGKSRPAEQRLAENERYRGRQAAAGIVRVTVMVPVDRIPHLKALTLQWRQEAKLLLEIDLPSADQILQIHAVCRTLGLDLPEEGFATRGNVQEWLLAHQPQLGRLMLHRPRRPHRP